MKHDGTYPADPIERFVDWFAWQISKLFGLKPWDSQ